MDKRWRLGLMSSVLASYTVVGSVAKRARRFRMLRRMENVKIKCSLRIWGGSTEYKEFLGNNRKQASVDIHIKRVRQEQLYTENTVSLGVMIICLKLPCGGYYFKYLCVFTDGIQTIFRTFKIQGCSVKQTNITIILQLLICRTSS